MILFNETKFRIILFCLLNCLLFVEIKSNKTKTKNSNYNSFNLLSEQNGEKVDYIENHEKSTKLISTKHEQNLGGQYGDSEMAEIIKNLYKIGKTFI
uniref:Uncharacterized protein n=1 Tax=Meloidogyne enterolobii TaxID=390850 RepID=A0A6V7X2J9_MELEN|nr:unnamed protein product [Meloidogyne enterolobii]